MHTNKETFWLLAGVVGILVISSAIGAMLQRRGGESPVLKNLNQRIATWWVMSGIFAFVALIGNIGTTVLFGLISFMALREFITLTPTKRGDHRSLFWTFFVIAPLQYYFVATGNYGMFTILVPVYAFLFIPARTAFCGDTEHFLERTAKIQWGLMVCVYCVSHAPALLTLRIPGFEGKNLSLLLFFVIVTQINDVLQYVWGKLFGKRKIAPLVSPNKTVEGFVGGTISASLIGMGLWWATPFSPWQAAAMSLLITLLGFSGGLTMSAIKRDRGVKDFGTMLQGHGGFLDRIDSICFAAPVFFHVTKFFFT
jgi:phosphatidate cytidylyltransferase